MMRTLSAGVTALLVLGAVGTAVTQPTRSGRAASPVEEQVRQLQDEIKALREDLAELKGARGGRPMAPMRPEMMPPMMQMMQACGQMMAMMGQMGGMAPPPAAQAPEGREPVMHGTKQAGGLEATLLSAPPLSPEAMQKMMPGMGGMKGMQGMGGMMGMGAGQPTHWIGVVVRDLKDDRVVPGLPITLTARKGGVTRTTTLMPMPGSYGANISLPEKGRYTVTVTIARSGHPVSLTFDLEYE